MNVINWTNKKQVCHKILLFPILEEIHRLLDTFDIVAISHVCQRKAYSSYKDIGTLRKRKGKTQMPSTTRLSQMNMNIHFFEHNKVSTNYSYLQLADSLTFLFIQHQITTPLKASKLLIIFEKIQ